MSKIEMMKDQLRDYLSHALH